MARYSGSLRLDHLATDTAPRSRRQPVRASVTSEANVDAGISALTMLGFVWLTKGCDASVVGKVDDARRCLVQSRTRSLLNAESTSPRSIKLLALNYASKAYWSGRMSPGASTYFPAL